MMTKPSTKAKVVGRTRQVGPIKPCERRKERLAIEKNTVPLGELISAMFDAARTETDDEDVAAYLAAMSTMDLLMRSRNGRALLQLLNL